MARVALAGVAAVIGAVLVACSGGSGSGPGVDAGPSPDLGCSVFPSDNPWNTDVSSLPVHPLSDDYIDSIGADRNLRADFGADFNGAPFGIPFTVVRGDQPRVEVRFRIESESDPGPYPIPPDAPIESGGDRHVIVVDGDNCVLYEMFDSSPQSDGSWDAFSGAVFDLGSNALRTDGFTSADAAGLPILAGLARYAEVVEAGAVNHALRVTVNGSQSGHIAPATHDSGSADSSLPPMGLRLRMNADFDCSALSAEVQVLCSGFKTYGLMVADNGSSWFVSGAPDPRWDDGALRDLLQIPGSAFEAVDTGPIL